MSDPANYTPRLGDVLRVIVGHTDGTEETFQWTLTDEVIRAGEQSESGYAVLVARALRAATLEAEVARLRELLDGKRTPLQLVQRVEVLKRAGVEPTPENIAYVDQLIDEQKEGSA